MSLPGTGRIPFGGDYNPEQWPEPVWTEDYRLFDAAGIDTVTVGVFTWALTQPAAGVYDFTTLDRIVGRAAAEGRQVCLATGTGAHPPWLAKAHPEVTRTDFEGRRHRYGQRHNSCPNSPVFRRLSAELARRLARRYGGHPALVAWHVGNEYGGACYCDLCAAAFREWLRQRYASLDALNRAWYTTFWSHVLTGWEQIEPPSALTEHWRGPDHTAFQGITLDYLRFMSDAMLTNFRDEKAAIRESDPDTPVTTNFMGLYRPVDYHRWAPHLDFASWDNYPPSHHPAAAPGPTGDPSAYRLPARTALAHDLIRGLKDGQPFWLMEQTPGTTACRDVNPLKPPGLMRLWSWQAVAHGADAVLFFQMRASRGASEKYHGAVIGHAGRADTRVFREVAGLGAELDRLGAGTLGARTPARVALLFDWDSWWALEISDGPSRLVRYVEVVLAYYQALWDAGVDVDVLPVTADLARYDVVLAPALHMVKGDLARRLEAVAARGGSVLATFLSGRVDEDDNAWLMDVPGPLGALMGVRVDEWDAAEADVVNPVRLGTGPDSVEVESRLLFELVIPQGAEVVGTYLRYFYAGTPAVTRNAYGSGHGWYVAAGLDQAGVDWVVRQVRDRHGLAGPYPDQPGVETTVRVAPDGSRLLFVLNHRAEPVDLPTPAAGVDLLTGARLEPGARMVLEPYGVRVVRS